MDPMLSAMFQDLRATLRDMQADTKANTRDSATMSKQMGTTAKRMDLLSRRMGQMAVKMDLMSARADHPDQNITKLLGTFASLEVHLVKLFEAEAETQAWKAKTDARLEAIEKHQREHPPAA